MSSAWNTISDWLSPSNSDMDTSENRPPFRRYQNRRQDIVGSHSGYGHSGYRDPYGSPSGYGGGHGGGHKDDCCPLVVDPLALTALLGLLAAATVFLNNVIQMTNLVMAPAGFRSQNLGEFFSDVFNSGDIQFIYIIAIDIFRPP